MFTIEKNIPIPSLSYGSSGKTIANFIQSMEIGDSFYIGTIKERTQVENSRNYLGKSGVKIVVRKIDNGFRCWRIK